MTTPDSNKAAALSQAASNYARAVPAWQGHSYFPTRDTRLAELKEAALAFAQEESQ